MIRIALVASILVVTSPTRSEYRAASIPSFRLVGDRWEIAADNGGNILSFKQAFDSMEGTGLEVRVKDMCASACTMVLHNPRACAEQAAVFGFHQSRMLSEGGKPVNAVRATNLMWAQYPEHVRARLGQLTPDMVYIKGTELLPACP
jgi:hypothetical protein